MDQGISRPPKADLQKGFTAVLQMVGKTKTHDHAAAEAIWLVKRYRPDVHCVEFYKVEPGDKVGIVKVCCEALAGQPNAKERNVG